MTEQRIGGGEVHYYQFSVEAGQYLRLVVEQQGAEVVTVLIGADGEPLIEADSAGKEYISVIAQQTMVYRVAVRARQRGGAAGRYLIRIEEQRPATPQDEIRVKAEKLMADGAQLSRLQDKENLRRAGEKYQAALKLWRELQVRREEMRAQYLLALVEHDSGELQAALDSYLQSLELSRAEGDLERENLTLSALGTLYYSLGDKRRAIDCYVRSLAFSRAQGNRALETSLLVNLGVAYKALGDSAVALDYYRQALPLAQEAGDRAMEAAVLTNLARLYDLTNDKRNSFAINQQALQVWRALGNMDGEAATLKNLGALAEAEWRLAEAQDYFNQALALSQKLGDTMREAHILADLARVGRAVGNFKDSTEQIERALKIIESTRGQLLNADLRASFAAANRRYYEFYIDLLMQQHLNSGVAGKRAQNYAAEALHVSERAHARALADLIAEARVDIRQGVDMSLLEREQNLARSLIAKKAERTALIKLSKNKEVSGQIESLDREILALSAAYEQAKAAVKRASPQYAALVHPEPVGLPEIQQKLLDQDSLLLEYALGEERSYLWVISHDRLQGYTLPSRAVIEEQAREFYDRLMARGETVKFEKPERRLARISLADGELQRTAATLSQTILGPAAELLGQKRLLIVGDGMLNYIPFGALPTPEGVKDRVGERVKGRLARVHPFTSSPLHPFTSSPLHPFAASPLIVDHEIVSLPSASVLAELRREIPNRRRATNDLAVVADPVFSRNDVRLSPGRNSSTLPNPSNLAQASASLVPSDQSNSTLLTEQLAATMRSSGDRDAQNLTRLLASRREAEGITRLAPGGRNLLALDFQANRGLVTGGALSQYRLLHFATHGLLNSQTSELSGLIFSLVDERGQPQSGVLRLNDIYNLKLAADLVVLSACRTGLGKEIRGEGAISMPRGFMYAGVPRVISSLWSVDDAATAELMTRFYRIMLNGQKSPAAALRAAQIDLWKEKKWQSPYYWAGFILQGEPN